MYEAEGVRVTTIGQTMAGCAIWTSVFMIKVCVDTASLGMLTFISLSGAGLV